MSNELQVYLLDPQEYAPETIAVAFAKTSRSPESFRQIASELNEAKSSEFNEKWVVGYGHSSVAEHAILHIAVENISRLATECLESNRLASYTEKSTRYQIWEAGAFFVPPELDRPQLRKKYIETCQTLLDTYQKFLPLVGAALKKGNPKRESESDPVYERRIRSMTSDVCRFLLPAAVLANVGMTINARALEHAITKMLSHPLLEVRRVGQSIKECAAGQLPTLLKYANADESSMKLKSNLRIANLPERNDLSWCNLVLSDPNAEDRILAACLYRFNNIDYTQAYTWIHTASSEEKNHLAQVIMQTEIRHSTPIRELEHADFTFDISLDQGAYYEVKRHRMLTLTPQPLTPTLGYAIPLVIQQAGLLETYCNCMDMVKEDYADLARFDPEIASYVIPNAFNRRFLLTSNLRSLLHFVKLRAAPNAHFSVRRLAQQISSSLSQELPSFAPYLRPCPQESTASIENENFYELQRR